MAIPGQVNPQLPKLPLLKEGYLLKRQRGQSSGADLRGLKFQQRFICLTQDYLEYFVDKKVCYFFRQYCKTVTIITIVTGMTEGREKGRLSCNPNEDH